MNLLHNRPMSWRQFVRTMQQRGSDAINAFSTTLRLAAPFREELQSRPVYSRQPSRAEIEHWLRNR